MSWLDIVLIYMSGILSGLIASAGIVLHVGSKILNRGKARAKELASNLKSDSLEQTALEPRMARIKEIAKQQMNTQAAHDGPQRNAMDGRYKNSLMKQMKELEEEKVSILHTILKNRSEER